MCHCCVDKSYVSPCVTVVLTAICVTVVLTKVMCHLVSLFCVLTAVCVTVLCVTVLSTSFFVLHQEMEAPTLLADTVVEPTPGQHWAVMLL